MKLHFFPSTLSWIKNGKSYGNRALLLSRKRRLLVHWEVYNHSPGRGGSWYTEKSTITPQEEEAPDTYGSLLSLTRKRRLLILRESTVTHQEEEAPDTLKSLLSLTRAVSYQLVGNVLHVSNIQTYQGTTICLETFRYNLRPF